MNTCPKCSGPMSETTTFNWPEGEPMNPKTVKTIKSYECDFGCVSVLKGDDIE